MTVHHAHGHGGTTVVESDREGLATALIFLVALVVIGVLVWFFAFSGVVIDRGGGGDVNIEQRNQNPPAQDNTNTNTNTDTDPVPTAT